MIAAAAAPAAAPTARPRATGPTPFPDPVGPAAPAQVSAVRPARSDDGAVDMGTRARR